MTFKEASKISYKPNGERLVIIDERCVEIKKGDILQFVVLSDRMAEELNLFQDRDGYSLQECLQDAVNEHSYIWRQSREGMNQVDLVVWEGENRDTQKHLMGYQDVPNICED